jgi:hypothetical protein
MNTRIELSGGAPGDDFRAAAARVGGIVTVRFEGTADSTIRPRLETMLGDIHRDALRERTTEVNVDLTKLEFMCSSCLRSFVGWITTIQEMESHGRYTVRFVSSRELLWQKRSLQALSAYAGDIVRVQLV